MDPKLIDWLRCPECRSRLTQPSTDGLMCESCGARYAIRDSVPRFVVRSTTTSVAFGYIWGAQAARVAPPTQATPYHLHQMHDALGAPPLTGLVLDAGCGDGVDFAMQALAPSREVIGVELSEGGVTTSRVRTHGLSRAHVVQGDLLHLPLADATFDAGYSYGVVHHTPDPAGAVREIARVLKPGAALLLYVYEDFGDRPLRWRAALAAANSFRAVTTRLPVSLLMTLCRVMSPVVWLTCTVPSRRFSWAKRFPYRHNTHPFSLVGDLYDRFSAPIEYRYPRQARARWQSRPACS